MKIVQSMATDHCFLQCLTLRFIKVRMALGRSFSEVHVSLSNKTYIDVVEDKPFNL